MPGVQINITRGADAPALRRDQVKPGMVFSVKNAQGRLGKKYAAIGMNGRMYSVNVDTGELCSSGNGNSTVTLVGKWAFDVNRTYQRGSRIGQRVLRNQVNPGEIFVVEGGHKEYAHLGRIDKDHRGWLSVPLANTENHAVTSKGDSHVTIVGTFAFRATLTK